MTTKTPEDKKGNLIKEGCLLKVFHFVAALRRKKHYLYKLVVKENDMLICVDVPDIAKVGFKDAHRCRLESCLFDCEVIADD